MTVREKGQASDKFWRRKKPVTFGYDHQPRLGPEGETNQAVAGFAMRMTFRHENDVGEKNYSTLNNMSAFLFSPS
jgi:hypothetical protein